MDVKDLNEDLLLTTSDNPFSPFTRFEDWYAWDRNNSYSTCERTARACPSQTELDSEDAKAEWNHALKMIIENQVTGVEGVYFRLAHEHDYDANGIVDPKLINRLRA